MHVNVKPTFHALVTGCAAIGSWQPLDRFLFELAEKACKGFLYSQLLSAVRLKHVWLQAQQCNPARASYTPSLHAAIFKVVIECS